MSDTLRSGVSAADFIAQKRAERDARTAQVAPVTGQPVERIALTELVFDSALTMRVTPDEEYIRESLCVAVRNGVALPPISVTRVDGINYVTDGYHRFTAHQLEGVVAIEAVVTDGTFRDAELAAYRSNLTHGQRLTNADKRHKALLVIRHYAADISSGAISINKIADDVGVGRSLLHIVRAELGIPLPDEGVVVRNGVEYVAKNPVKTRQRNAAERSERAVAADDLEERVEALMLSPESYDETHTMLPVGREEPSAALTLDGLFTSVRNDIGSVDDVAIMIPRDLLMALRMKAFSWHPNDALREIILRECARHEKHKNPAT